jgi:signal peptidase II
MKQNSKRVVLLILIFAAVVALDQWTKTWVRNAIGIGESIAPISFLGDFFRLLHSKNTGAAFGILQNANLILMFLGFMIIGVLVWYYFSMKENNGLIRVGLALAIGGAFGNLVDRVTQGYVTDFLSFGRFPIFNVGDSAVTVGVGLMVLALLLESKHQKPVKKDEPETKDGNA